jgi:hypothetical protein
VQREAFLQEREAIQGQIQRARERIAAREGEVCAVEGELAALAEQRHRYELLEEVCDALERLESAGAGELFWGGSGDSAAHARVERARGQAAQFLENVATIEKRRADLLLKIEDELIGIDEWNAELVELQDKELRRQSEFLIEREMSAVPFRPMAMPWDPQGEDARRFRKVLFITLLVTILIGTGLGLWKLPKEDKYQVVAMPERVVKMVQQKAPPPPPAPVKPVDQPPETAVADNKGSGQEPDAAPGEVKQPRAKAQGSGLLAFRNSFSDLMGGPEPKLGADAQLGVSARNNGGSRAIGANTERSLLVAQASSGSGGIQVAPMSRGLGGGGKGDGSGGGMEGVRIARVTDAIGGGDGGGGRGGGGGSDRPLSRGPGPSRTDEEIQIVFDRYKAALYRIYNRELRNDPTLRGKMVLRLIIEPNGEVSSCKVESTDLHSPSLVAEIVDRVGKFNFGPKEKVSRVTILYPIDFLPAN